jgi:hypothetical protein
VCEQRSNFGAHLGVGTLVRTLFGGMDVAVASGPPVTLRVEWVGKTVALAGGVFETRSHRGTSGLHRAGRWVTPTRGNPREQCNRK